MCLYWEYLFLFLFSWASCVHCMFLKSDARAPKRNNSFLVWKGSGCFSFFFCFKFSGMFFQSYEKSCSAHHSHLINAEKMLILEICSQLGLQHTSRQDVFLESLLWRPNPLKNKQTPTWTKSGNLLCIWGFSGYKLVFLYITVTVHLLCIYTCEGSCYLLARAFSLLSTHDNSS